MAQSTIDMQSAQAIRSGLIQSAYPGEPRSYVNAESTAEIPFGVLVVQATDEDESAKLPDGTGDVPYGVVCFSHAYARGTELGSTGLTPKTEMGVLGHGTIWVATEDAVDPGDAVRVRTSGTGQLGAFRAAQDTTNTAVLTGARWLTSTSGAGVALLELNMTGATLTEDV